MMAFRKRFPCRFGSRPGFAEQERAERPIAAVLQGKEHNIFIVHRRGSPSGSGSSSSSRRRRSSSDSRRSPNVSYWRCP